MSDRRYPLTPSTDLLIMDASAPHAGYGAYRRIALCEVAKGATPGRIDARSRGMARIVETWEHLRDGTAERCAFHRGLAEAHESAGALLEK